MLAGLFMLVIISLLYPYFHSPVALFTIRFMQGVAIAAFSTTATAIVADLFADRKGEVMGTYNAFKGAGYALGPILGGLVTQYFNFFDTFPALRRSSGHRTSVILALCQRKRRCEAHAQACQMDA